MALSATPKSEKDKNTGKKISTGVFNADKENAHNYIVDEFKNTNQLTEFPNSLFKVVRKEVPEKDIVKHQVTVHKDLVQENINQLEAQVAKLKDLLSKADEYEQPSPTPEPVG